MTLAQEHLSDAPASRGLDGGRGQLARFLEALQPGRMGARLDAARGGTPSPIQVLDAKFEPGVRAMLLYRRGPELLVGDVSPNRDLELSECVVPPGVRIWPFPMDPQLPTLPLVLDRDVLGQTLGEAIGRPPALSRHRTARSRTSLLRFRPGKRVTLQTALVGDRSRFVVKAYHDAEKAAMVAAEGPRLAAAATGTNTLSLAPIVGHAPFLRIVAQRVVSGLPLDALLTCGSWATLETAVVASAHALAEFHQLTGTTRRHRSVAKELVRFRDRATAIADVDPRVGDALTALADRLLAAHDSLPAALTGLVHGDCKPSQFLLSGRRAYLLDLDHVGLSEQAVDVGTFLASVRQCEIRRRPGRPPAEPSAPVAALSRSFLSAYRDVRGPGLDPARIRWHEAAALERKALRAFARAPASPLPLALAAEANRCLDGLDAKWSQW